MALTSYNEFQTVVGNYLSRDDLTSQVPDFIRFAEDRLSRDLRVRQMLKVATTAASSSAIEIPSDFIELRDLHIQGTPNYNLEYQTPDLFYRNAYASTSGIPKYYSLVGDEIVFAPAPDSSYTVQMLYYYKPDRLSSTNQSNIFLENFPDALLYATLAESEPYLMNDERIGTWASMYDRAIQNIKANDLGSRYPNTSLGITVR